MKPTKCPAKKKNNKAGKEKEEGRRESEKKIEDCCVTFKPKN